VPVVVVVPVDEIVVPKELVTVDTTVSVGAVPVVCVV